MSESESDGDDEAVDMSARLSAMLKPVNKKQKKTVKRIDVLEGLVATLTARVDEAVPAMRRAVDACVAESSERVERLTVGVAQCAQKTQLELLRQEVAQSAARERAAIDEMKARSAAQEMLLQSLHDAPLAGTLTQPRSAAAGTGTGRRLY